MNDHLLHAIQEDFPDIEYSLLFQDFLRTIRENDPEWYGIIIAGPDDMQWWHAKLLPESGELMAWHQIYKKQHPDAKGYFYKKGIIERPRVSSFFSRTYHLTKG